MYRLRLIKIPYVYQKWIKYDYTWQPSQRIEKKSVQYINKHLFWTPIKGLRMNSLYKGNYFYFVLNYTFSEKGQWEGQK